MGKRFKTPTNKWQRFLIESAKDAAETVRFYEGRIKLCSPGSATYRQHVRELEEAKQRHAKALKDYEERWNEPEEEEA